MPGGPGDVNEFRGPLPVVGARYSPLLSDRLLSSAEAQRAYRMCPLFHALVAVVQNAESLQRVEPHVGHEDPAEVLGRALAQVSAGREEWLALALRRLEEYPQYFATRSERWTLSERTLPTTRP